MSSTLGSGDFRVERCLKFSRIMDFKDVFGYGTLINKLPSLSVRQILKLDFYLVEAREQFS